MKVVAFAGGTGSAKLLRGLSAAVGDLTVVANVGDNFWVHGLYVCPDVDICLYSLAGMADVSRGWGLGGDTYTSLAQMGRLGAETWFNLGDGDLALSVLRTEQMRAGASLTLVTERFGKALGVKQRVLPATDDEVETHILTPGGELHLQEYWVRDHGRPAPVGVRYLGAEDARPSKEVSDAVKRADKIVFCPANPITSIGPILSIGGMRERLRHSKAAKIAVSPMVGKSPFSGPAGRLMKGLGMRPDSVGVAMLYSGLVDVLVIDMEDARLERGVEKAGLKPAVRDTRMDSSEKELALAKELLRI